MFIMICCLTGHVFLIQYLDLTLIAAGSCIAIGSAVVISIVFLGEKFIWQYDLVAFILITIGCGTIVTNANFTETTYTSEEVK